MTALTVETYDVAPDSDSYFDWGFRIFKGKGKSKKIVADSVGGHPDEDEAQANGERLRDALEAA